MHRLLEENIDKIENICRTNNIKTLFVFGSICTDKFDDNSDVDFLISIDSNDFGEYADTFFIVAEELEKILKRPVDLVTEKSLSNPYFIQSINQTKTLIYAA